MKSLDKFKHLPSKTICLIDVNNFFVACEQLFDPKLLNKPVVVLSNNDGCVISRSQEAKDIGIKMGVPWHEIMEIRSKYQVKALSSNFALYADMSNRVMSFLDRFSPAQEVYSVDESFLDFSIIPKTSLTEEGRSLREQLLKQLGLAVGCGIAPTKTLSKIASHLAKKRKEFGGVCNYFDFSYGQINQILSTIDVGEIWGVGRRLGPHLRALNIRTVLDLKKANPQIIRKKFSILLERTVLELNEIACIDLELENSPRKSIISSRTFGKLTREFGDLAEAIATYIGRAAEKLRKQNSLASLLYLYIRTNPYGTHPQYKAGVTVSLDCPTDSTIKLIEAGIGALRKIYQKGYYYQKAGVMLSGLESANLYQPNFYDSLEEFKHSRALMKTFDSINKKFGKSTIQVAQEGLKKTWSVKANLRTPRYTTDFQELAVVKA